MASPSANAFPGQEPPITTVAGNGTPATLGQPDGDGGPATSANVGQPIDSVSATTGGNFLLTDRFGNVVRQVVGGTISVAAGTGAPPGVTSDGPVATTPISQVIDLAQRHGGGFYMLEPLRQSIQLVNGGFVTTVVGKDGTNVIHGVPVLNPTALATFTGNDLIEWGDGAGAIHQWDPLNPMFDTIVDSGWQTVRALATDYRDNAVPGDTQMYALVETQTNQWVVIHRPGFVPPFAGGGGSFSDGPALNAQLQDPSAIAAAQGPDSVVIVERGSNKVRLVADGQITTIVNSLGTPCVDPTAAMNPCGDGLPADQAQLQAPDSVDVTPEGLLIGDSFDARIRLVASTEVRGKPAALSNTRNPFFIFDSWDPHAHFKCQIDSDTPVDFCTSPFQPTGLADGAHTFTLTYVDPRGDADPTPYTYNWTIDATPPDAPSIDTNPAADTNQTDASFTFTAAEAAGTMMCALDSATPAACDTPTSQSFSSLPDGAHTFHVFQVDAANNNGTEATYQWTVDTQAPLAPVLGTKPALNSVIASASFSFTGEPGGTVLCKLDSGSFAACDSATGQSYAGLADGSHTFYVHQVDNAANVGADATYTWSVDTAAPSFTGNPQATTRFQDASFTWTMNDDGGTVECKLDTNAYVACSSRTAQSYSSLVEGQHTFSARQVDTSGNPGTAATYQWLIDYTAPPAPTIVTKPAANTSNVNASFSWALGEAGGTVQCRLDTGSFTTCATPTTQSYAGLADGSHTFSVRQVDAANNVGSQLDVTWNVDTQAPAAPTLDQQPNLADKSTTASFTFTPAEDPSLVPGDIVQCKLDLGIYQTCQTPNSQSYSSLAEGSHTFYVRERDAAANIGTETTYTWTIDTTAPLAPNIDSGPANQSVVDGTQPVVFAFTPAEAGGTMECKLNSGPYTACDSATGQTYNPLPDNSYTFSVHQVDAAGNAGPAATRSWISDTGPPAKPTITAKPDAITGSTTASFTFAPAEGGGQMKCKLDSGAFTDCTSATAQSYQDLGEGPHTFAVHQVDAANNVGPDASWSWSIDLTPPALPVLEAPADGAGTLPPRPNFSWDAASGAVKYELMIDSQTVATVTNCAATCSATAPSDITEATHKWKVRALDEFGNAITTAEHSFSVAVAPVAMIVAAPNPVLAGRAVTFDASGSTDYGTGIGHYEWDADGDGVFETDTGATPTLTTTFSKPGSVKASVRVTDGVGLSSTASTTLNVTSLAPTGKPVGISINDGAQFTNDPHVTLFAVWPSFATTMLVSNDGGFGSAQTFPVSEQLPWVLDSSGPERLPKTVYVRFQAATPTTQNFTDDIILDQTPPKVLQASVVNRAGTARATAAAAAKETLALKATDNVSGVAGVQITSNKRKPGKLLKYRKKLQVAASKKLFVRARDKAGNLSPWKPVKNR